MGRNLVIGIIRDGPVLSKISTILSDLNIHGVNIVTKSVNENDPEDSVILLYEGDYASPIISAQTDLSMDLCHVARSSKIPCKFIEGSSRRPKIYLPHLPEENLDGDKPTMCLENQIKFLELVLTRYIKNWFY